MKLARFGDAFKVKSGFGNMGAKGKMKPLFNISAKRKKGKKKKKKKGR